MNKWNGRDSDGKVNSIYKYIND